MNDTLSYQIQQLLKLNDIKLDFEELSFQIQSHPTYPSLHAVTGVLDHFNIANLALDIPAISETLKQLPMTFLAQVEVKEQKEFAVIKKMNHNYQLVFNSKHKTTLIENDFLNQFTGIILVIDKEESKTTNTIKIGDTLSKVFGCISLFMVGLIFILSGANTIETSFLALSLLGFYVSMNILKQEDGETSVLGSKFCSEVTEKKNCNAVLNSKGAAIYRGIKLSDLSIIYFSSLAISTFILTINNSSVFLVKLLAFSAFPVTLYSIYYQAKVIKKWCALCLGIVGVVWALTAISVINFYPNYNLNALFITTLSFSATIAFWLYQSELLTTYKSLKVTKVEHLKFVRNFDLFSSQLNSSKRLDTSLPLSNEIILGNPKAQLHIVAITNPLCSHCKPVHKLIETILKQFKDRVKITIRFNVNTKNDSDKALQIAMRLQELNDLNFDSCLIAMNDIYGGLSVAQWIEKWQTVTNKDKYIQTLINQQKWCSENAINFTPELLINGRSYPKIYNRKDLIYFIEDLQEQSQINKQQTEAKATLEV